MDYSTNYLFYQTRHVSSSAAIFNIWRVGRSALTASQKVLNQPYVYIFVIFVMCENKLSVPTSTQRGRSCDMVSSSWVATKGTFFFYFLPKTLHVINLTLLFVLFLQRAAADLYCMNWSIWKSSLLLLNVHFLWPPWPRLHPLPAQSVISFKNRPRDSAADSRQTNGT